MVFSKKAPEAGPSVVVIVAEGRDCRVVPGTVVVKIGKEVKFAAVRTTAKLFFPDPEIFRENCDPVIELAPGKEVSFHAGGRTGSHPYAVACRLLPPKFDKKGEEEVIFAKGNSDPRIIIY